MLEGVLCDTLARQMEEDSKDSLLDEVWDLEFTGSRIAKKAPNLIRAYKNIYIDKGKEIFIAIPQIEEKNQLPSSPTDNLYYIHG